MPCEAPFASTDGTSLLRERRPDAIPREDACRGERARLEPPHRLRRREHVGVLEDRRAEDAVEQASPERRAEEREGRLVRVVRRPVDEVDPRVRGRDVPRTARDHVRVDPELPALLRNDVLRLVVWRLRDHLEPIAVPGEAAERLALDDRRRVRRRVDRVDERPEVEQEAPNLLELALVLGVERVAHHQRDGADHLVRRVEQRELARVLLEQREELRPRARPLLDQVGAVDEARRPPVLRHRPRVARIPREAAKLRIDRLLYRRQLCPVDPREHL